MLNLLDRYGGKPFLKKVLTAWHEAVVAERDIRHYFINVTPEILLIDQLNYMAFIMTQPDRVYRESPYQSAPLDVQVRASVFDEVLVELRKILTQAGVHRDFVPRMSSQIVEIAEESRAQAEDIVITTWKPVDITPENILRFYNKQRGDARFEANNDIYANRGYAYPFWTRILRETQQIMFFSSADIQEWSNMDELKKVVAQANEKVPSLKFQAIETYPLPQFRTQYLVPYQNEVPTRLFLRAARQFATFFDMGMGVDKKERCLTQRIGLKLLDQHYIPESVPSSSNHPLPEVMNLNCVHHKHTRRFNPTLCHQGLMTNRSHQQYRCWTIMLGCSQNRGHRPMRITLPRTFQS